MAGINFKAFDLGGHEIARRVWKDYYAKVRSANKQAAEHLSHVNPKRLLNGLRAAPNRPYPPFGKADNLCWHRVTFLRLDIPWTRSIAPHV